MSTGSTEKPLGQKPKSTNANSGRGKRQSREDKGLPPLTREQTMVRSLIQQAQNACGFLKKQVDDGKTPSKKVLEACGVLSASLGASLGTE